MFVVKNSCYAMRHSISINDMLFNNGLLVSDIESKNVKTLVVPCTNRKTFLDRSIVFAGPELWNSLPERLRVIEDLNIFKNQLKTYCLNVLLRDLKYELLYVCKVH